MRSSPGIGVSRASPNPPVESARRQGPLRPRRDLARSRRGIPESVGEDLLLSVGEATANSARHAYLGALAGKVTVRITLTDDVLNVEISDNGRWRDRSDDHSAGLGSQIIASLTEDLRVEKTGRGTMVAFRLPVSPSKREDVPSPSRR